MILLFKGLKRPGQCMPNVSNTNREVIAMQEMRRKLPGYRSLDINVPRNGEAKRVVGGLSVMPISDAIREDTDILERAICAL